MKYRIYILIIVALGLGFWLGYFFGKGQQPIKETHIVTNHIVDTLIQPKVIEVPVEIEKKIKEVDTVYVQSHTLEPMKVDSQLDIIEVLKDTPQTEDLILRDRKIGQTVEKVNFLTPIEADSLLMQLLEVKPVKSDFITIEFWESPLSYSGYKLSKTKLIIYGLFPSEDIQFYQDQNIYYLQHNGLFYRLVETEVYLNYEPIEKPNIIND